MSGPKRTMFQVTSHQSGRLFSQLMIYGDQDDQTREALFTMLAESMAIALAEEGCERVVLTRHWVSA